MASFTPRISGLRAFVSLGVANMLFALAPRALADVAPPPGYVEECTVEKQGGADKCVLCGDAYHGDVDACERKHAASGYEKRCQTAGASTWEEVWCQPGAVPQKSESSSTPPEAAPEKGGGCGACSAPGGSGDAPAALLVTAALGAVLLRRRR